MSETNEDAEMPDDHLAVSVGTLRAVLRELGHDEDEIEAAFRNANKGGESGADQYE